MLDERKLDLKKLTLGNAPKVNKVDMLISDYVNVNVNIHTNPEEIISMLTSGTMGEPFDVKWRVRLVF